MGRHDNGWIHTLLEEAENERMHLMTFLNMKQPSIFFRAGVLAAQGVFFNAFFFSYLISPRTCHRFVGYLEEEAVRTYTHALNDIDSGGTDARQWAKEERRNWPSSIGKWTKTRPFETYYSPSEQTKPVTRTSTTRFPAWARRKRTRS